MLALVAALSLSAAPSGIVVEWLALIALSALPAVLAPEHRVIGPLARLAEVVTTCLAAATIAHLAHGSEVGVAATILPYLTVPVVSATLFRRRAEVPILLVAAVTILTTAKLADDQLGNSGGYTVSTIQWLGLTGVAAAVAGTLQYSLLSQRDSPQPYAEATRLLTQLRSVARQLPGATLDPRGLAEHLLDEIREAAPADRAAVLSAGGGSRLVVLAQAGVDHIDWETSLDMDSAIADAWASQQPQLANRSQARSGANNDVSALVVPLLAGLRTVGLLAIEADRPGAYPPLIRDRVAALAAPAALRLEAALLFDEVRALATNEERQRLAREIHDGVAQELVMVGYGIDNALATLPDDANETGEELRTLRAEVTRVITELRLSLFELRADVDRQGGLTAAISEYARTAGAAGGMRVNLTMVDSTARLPASVEAELLRIAQEAITNARKHAGASNLWVTCVVDPPFAQVEVSDDGQGIADQRPDGRYGLAIMAERAERIRGRLEIRPRQPNGTTVAVALGTPLRRGNTAV
jgi:signal transduction histidine kinase